ncbi:MAG TPA: FAD-dependent oxidoreductase, partial [bacterium]|nr:FAD-dependent oxidoreductase [bacterium]
YDRLLICSGGVPHVPEIYYQFRPYLTRLKRLSTAREIRKRLPEIRKIVLLGGDLISVRLAAALIQSGREVTFVLDDYAFWPVDAVPEIRESLEKTLDKMGAEVLSGDPMVRVEQTAGGHPPQYTVVTRSGREIPAEMVGAFFGFKPDVDFLIRSGLDIDRGILVNDHLQTAHEDVYAAGDCAQVYAPQLKNYWVSVGWKNAMLLGEIAAHNMVGQGEQARKPPVELFEFSNVQLKTPWWQAL